MGNQKRTDGVL